MELWQYKVLDLGEGCTVVNSFEMPIESIDFDIEDVQILSPLSVEVTLFRIDLNVFINFVVEVTIRVECRLCLLPLEQQLRAEFSAQYEHTLQQELLEDPFVEVGIRYYTGDYLDLAKDIRETLLLELPQWSVCSEECAGLCPVCGENRNLKQCGCDESALKPSKFAALSSLLDD